MNSKEKYRLHCKTEKTIPIFSRDWWLDTVIGEDYWDVVIVEKNNEIIASLPYLHTRKLGFTISAMPKLTQNLGPWIKYPANPDYLYANKIAFEKKILNQLICQLPEFSYFNQNFNHKVTNWLPFYWNGYQQTTRYTYIIKKLEDLDKVFKEIKKSQRNSIYRAEGELTVYADDDIEEFFHLNSQVFKNQGLEAPYTLDFIKKLDAACIKHDARKIFFAKDKNGNIHSALYLVWDEMSSYDLMGGTNPKFKNSNAKSLLVWEAIKYSSTVTKQFDFEGSMIERVERFFRSFGAHQTPYFNISKTNSKILKLKQGLTKMMK